MAWLHRFVDYVATKEALAQELFAYVDRDADVFTALPHDVLRAPENRCSNGPKGAGVVRPDTDITDVVRMVAGIAKMPSATPEQIDRVLDIALDGLRPRAAGYDGHGTASG